MKLTLDRSALLKALEPVQRIIERRNTIPILANVLLRADAGGLVLTGTDLDIEMRTSTAAEVATPGALTLPAATLYDIARKLPEGAQVAIEQNAAGERVTVRAGRSRFQVQSLPESDFPDITAGEPSHRFTLSAKALLGLVEATQFAISTEETRYYLNGVHLHDAGEGLLAAVATDGHRLARIHLPLPEGAAGMPAIIIPRKAISEIGRLVAKGGDTLVEIDLSATKIRLVMDGMRFTSKLIDGTFPDYQRVIPAANDKRATIDTDALARAVDRVATISSERGRAVKLSLSAGAMALSVTNPDAGDAREEIDIDYDGEPIEIGFNARYLQDILAVLGGDTILMKLADPGSPTILQTRDGAALLTVLMPMRV
jgi:DNA polymerase III subunit beta